MHEEHQNQQDLPDLSKPVSDQVREMSEVAKVQAEVLPLGLVRVDKPVFVYDANLAQQKSDNALRQARFREKRAARGLVAAQIPAEIVEKLKAAGGDWSKLTQVQVQEVRVEVPVEVVKTIEVIKEVRVEVPVEIIKTVEIVKEVRVEVHGKPVLKLSAEQKKTFLLGQKVQDLSGFRRFLVQKIVGF